MKLLPSATLALLCACGTSGTGTANPPLNSAFAGTWGGLAQFSIGNDTSGALFVTNATIPSALFVTVSGNSASVSGICPDGTGSLALAGTGGSASQASTVTCPTVNLGGCEVILTYTAADLALSGPQALKLDGTGTATGCNETVGFDVTFNGVLAAAGEQPVPGWDLRFKAVGESLVLYGGGFGGGAAPEVDYTFTTTGRGFMFGGIVAGGGFLLTGMYGASQTALYQNSLWADGVDCSTTFSQALDGHNVITALDGDPYLDDAVCIILAIAQADGGPTLQYLSEEAATASDIVHELTASTNGRSFVLTALYAVDAGLYTYVAESLGQLADGGYQQFDTVIQMPLVADLATAAEALADAGYVITASAWQGEAYYTLVGTRPVGSTATHATVTMMTNDGFAGLQDILANGYVPVSLLQDYYTLPDGGVGADTWLIGEK